MRRASLGELPRAAPFLPAAQELIGRETELAAIRELVGSAAAGHAPTLLISGDPGIGKTALLGATAAMAKRAGMRVLRGDCVRFEMRRAFGPFVDALRPLRGDPSADAVLALGAAVDGDVSTAAVDRYRSHTLFLRALAAAAEERPLLLALDDIHWADGSSLELFEHLARRSVGGVLLAGTYRPGKIGERQELRRTIADLPSDRVHAVRLQPLTTAESETLVSRILGPDGRVPASVRARIVARCGGDPLFLIETLRALAGPGDARRTPRPDDLPLPASVDAAVRERLAGLEEGARQVMVVAATIGDRFELDVVRRASGMADDLVIGALRRAVAAQLISEHGEDGRDTFAFRHPLVREAVLGDLLRIERRALHRRVAEALEERGSRDDDLSPLAFHWDEAGDRTRALAYHRRAATHEARRFAHTESLDHLIRGLALSENDATTLELSLEASAMARVLGRDRRALDHAKAAAAIAERLGDRLAQARALLAMEELGSQVFWSRAERRALIDRALAVLAPLGETPELAAALGVEAWHLASSEGGIPAALDRAERAIGIAERHPGTRLMEPYSRLALVHMKRGDAQATIDALRKVVSAMATERLRGPNQANAVAFLRTLLERRNGETEETRALQRLGEELKQRYGTLQTYHQRLHLLLFSDWDGYVRLHDAHRDDPDEADFVRTHQALHRAFIEAARNGESALDAARTAYAECLRYEDVTESDFVMCEVALVAGRPDVVLEVAERAARVVAHPDATAPFLGYIGIYAVLAARERGDDDAARLWAARLPPLDHPAAAFHPGIRTVTGFGAAERDWIAGRRDAAIDRLATLIDERRAGEGRTMLGPGEALWHLTTYFLGPREIDMRVDRNAPGDRERAAALLAWIAGFYGKFHATSYLSSLRERAERWGIAFPQDESSASPSLDLTAREREVALLVAQGLTNREIAERLTLSVRTAESHVERIRAKLGFRTRAQVASWATETLRST